MSRTHCSAQSSADSAGPSATNLTQRPSALRVGEPDDAFEREADRVADAVMRGSGLAGGGTGDGGGRTRSPSGGTSGGGRPLPAATRAFFEPRFGYDFGTVRIHADAHAAESASRLSARAFTLGRDVTFGAGEYAPETDRGRRLLAHELTHVVQQSARRAPAGVVQRTCLRTEEPSVTSEGSSKLTISETTPPCLACPNSPRTECPKLADRQIPPGSPTPVHHSWQVRFQVWKTEGGFTGPGAGKFSHVVQKIEKNVGFTTAPAAAYAYTPVYWEAFDIDGSGLTEVDYWQFELPDGTAGDWDMTGTLYLVRNLPSGMVAGAVADAGSLASTTAKPKKLGPVRGSRRISASFDFTGPNKRHTQ